MKWLRAMFGIPSTDTDKLAPQNNFLLLITLHSRGGLTTGMHLSHRSGSCGRSTGNSPITQNYCGHLITNSKLKKKEEEEVEEEAEEDVAEEGTK